MKRIAAVIVMFLAGTLTFAMEIESLFLLNTLNFAWNRTETDRSFPGSNWGYGGRFTIQEDINEDFAVDVTYETDPVLRHVMYATFSYNMDFLEFQIGPFFGLLNSPTVLMKPGLSTDLRLTTGVVFLQLHSDSTLGGISSQVGDYMQGRNEISVGFTATNIDCSLGMNNTRYTDVTETGQIIDEVVQYFLRADLGREEAAFSAGISLMYQNMKLSFVPTLAIQTWNSAILGTRLRITPTPGFTIILDLESNLYSFGQDDLLGVTAPDEWTFLFRLGAGIALDFEAIAAQRSAREAETAGETAVETATEEESNTEHAAEVTETQQ